ncbi:outer membrane beta-barrel protein [Myroides ceti]|uniref:Outer membrane beta-barrel protein n=1 Tax=Paenimyroides ceti TaxID=395087 RepID=A0ABT8CPQ5_9FLAO|nr:outer membrane beta-barrel protein [Paenimyroides ceti]MDN3705537.1 outer membrane beta-barrel protein [Paenimyroides ceti]MDN3708806.1 outer membrane beta-barrel protein [Paenimyroides ceti]
MKKNLFLIGLLFSAVSFVNAQEITTPQYAEKVGTKPIQQGNWMIGGSLGSLGYSFEGENFNINVTPRAGYFISDGIAIGLGVNAGLETVKDGDNIWNYGVMPFVRYYFPEGASSTGRFFGQGEIGISGSNGGTSDTSFAFGIGAGYAHFISQNVALEAIAGYNYSKSNASSAQAQNGLGFAVGFQIYLPGKK